MAVSKPDRDNTRRMAIANWTCVSWVAYAPGTIVVYVTIMDRKRIQCLSNASQHVPIYLQPFLRYSELLVENCDIFTPHLCLAGARRNFAKILIYTKLEWMGYPCDEESMTIYSAVLIQYQRVTDGRTDRQTDSLTHVKTFRPYVRLSKCPVQRFSRSKHCKTLHRLIWQNASTLSIEQSSSSRSPMRHLRMVGLYDCCWSPEAWKQCYPSRCSLWAVRPKPVDLERTNRCHWR